MSSTTVEFSGNKTVHSSKFSKVEQKVPRTVAIDSAVNKLFIKLSSKMNQPVYKVAEYFLCNLEKTKSSVDEETGRPITSMTIVSKQTREFFKANGYARSTVEEGIKAAQSEYAYQRTNIALLAATT